MQDFSGIFLKKSPFDERLKDLIAFKAEFGHCNVPFTRSRNNNHYSLGLWCNDMRICHKAIKEGGIPKHRLSKADFKRLENAGFQWSLYNTFTFDERFNDLMAFKAEYASTRSRNNTHTSLGLWCSGIRRSYKAIKEGGISKHTRLSEADIQRLEKAGFEWRFK